MNMKKRFLWIFFDFVAAALILLAVYIVNFKIPQKGIEAIDVGSVFSQEHSLDTTKIIFDSQDWQEKFSGKFTDQVVSSDTSYTSPNLSVQLSYVQYDTGIVDRSFSGKYEKYGSKTSYVVADIYVGDITCFQTAFAQDTYGAGYTEKLTDMSARMQSILAVNGDNCSNNRNQDNGTIIRNGVIYRQQQTGAETCVLYWDGTMEILPPGEVDIAQLKERGAYQAWVFGPSLLDENGKAKSEFLVEDYVTKSHPRTAIGYYEPGHYCLLLVDGRQTESRGMFLRQYRTEKSAKYRRV